MNMSALLQKTRPYHRSWLVLGACAFIAVLNSAPAQATASDTDFAAKATIGGDFEIQSSKIALQRSQNDDVKHFAQEMIDDHTQAGQALEADLPKTKVDPTKLPKALDSKHQKMIDKLTTVSDKDFDAAYVKMQRKAHIDTVSLFKDYASGGKDPSLKAFAQQTLPTLQHHLDEVKALSTTKK